MKKRKKFILIGVMAGLITGLVNCIEIVIADYTVIFKSIYNLSIFLFYSLLNISFFIVILMGFSYLYGLVLSFLVKYSRGLRSISDKLVKLKTTVYIIIFLLIFIIFNRWISSQYPLDPLKNPTRPFKKYSSIKSDEPNVMIIVLDTLRAKSLYSYGYKVINMPHLNQFTQEASLFLNTIATSSHTAPSHLSIISSNFVDSEVMDIFVDKTLTEVLGDKGYLNIGVIANRIASSQNFMRGFDIYIDSVSVPLLYQYFLSFKILYKFLHRKIFDYQYLYYHKHCRAEKVNKILFPLLKKYKNEKLFLFVNYFDPHDPYFPLEPNKNQNEFSLENGYIRKLINWKKPKLDKDQWRKIETLYHQELNYLDKYLGDLFEKMKELNIWDNTIIIITSDHGELLGEKGLLTHAIALHEEEIRVPLMIRYPPKVPKGNVITNQVQILDIAPTIYNLLGYEIPKKVHGKSLLPFIKGIEYPDYPEFAFSLQYDYRSLQNNKWKFVYDLKNNEAKLFNLEKDHEELLNVADKYVEKKDFFIELYSVYKKKYEESQNEKAKENREELLRSLGYIK